MAMLLITHDLAIVGKMAHRVALMYAGQIVEVAETKEFFARPLHPYAVNLFAALPDTGKRGAGWRRFRARCRRSTRCSPVAALPIAAHVRCRCVAAPPPLFEPSPGHPVRCLLYNEGGAGREPALAAALPRRSDRRCRVDSDRPRRQRRSLRCDVRDYRVWFPIRKGL